MTLNPLVGVVAAICRFCTPCSCKKVCYCWQFAARCWDLLDSVPVVCCASLSCSWVFYSIFAAGVGLWCCPLGAGIGYYVVCPGTACYASSFSLYSLLCWTLSWIWYGLQGYCYSAGLQTYVCWLGRWMLLQRLPLPAVGHYLDLGEVLSPCPHTMPLVSFWFYCRSDSAGFSRSLLWIPTVWVRLSPLMIGLLL